MNPDPFTEYIERVVVPVRASAWRKDQMREELAAHLAASWEQEHGQGGAAEAAAERAIRRMGEPGELTNSLQDSVPRFERWLCTPIRSMAWLDVVDRVLAARAGETPIHHAVRATVLLMAAIAAAELIVVPVATALRVRPHPDWPTTVAWAIASLVVTGAGGIIFIMLGDAMTRAMAGEGTGRMRVTAYLVLSSLVAIGLGLGFALIVSTSSRDGLLFDRSDWPRLIAASLIAPPMLAYTARESVARRRRRSSEWGVDGTSA